MLLLYILSSALGGKGGMHSTYSYVITGYIQFYVRGKRGDAECTLICYHLFACSRLDEINQFHNRKDVVFMSDMTCQSPKYHIDCIDSARFVCMSNTTYTRHGDTSALKRQ